MSERIPFEHQAGDVAAMALLIVAASDAQRQAGEAAAARAGIGAVKGVSPSAADGALAAAAIDIVLGDIRTLADEDAAVLLEAIDDAARAAPLRVVVVLGDAQIDLATALLFGPHVQHLCDPSMTEMAAALADAARVRGNRAEESSRDDERLRRLNDEVARIAETLARLTQEAGGVADPVVHDIARGYGAPPAAIAPATSSDVRGAIRARRMRGQYFDQALFADPAWDMLLDLFAAGIENTRVSVSSLCIAAAVPGTTALRWIGAMTEAGLFERHADPNDRRRAHVQLSTDASAAMRGYFMGVKAVGLMAA